jgi:predicted SnoaL-like aldol condensation-catalyzing enzyme
MSRIIRQAKWSHPTPKPLVAVDIFKVKNNKVVERWDVTQEEVPGSETASGNPMFTSA